MTFFNGKDEPEQGYTVADLQAQAARIEAVLDGLIADFTDERDNEPLGPGDRKVASRTPDLFLKKAADVCRAAPDLREMPPRAEEVLDLTYAAQVIFARSRAKAKLLVSLMDDALYRKKLVALPIARLVHRIARLVVESGAGKWLTRHVADLNALMGRPSAKKKIRDAEDSSGIVNIPQQGTKERSGLDCRTGHERTSPSPSADAPQSRAARDRASDGRVDRGS